MKYTKKGRNKKYSLKNKTKKRRIHLIKSKTPKYIQSLTTNGIAKGNDINSYSPSINERLVILKSLPRSEIIGCNNTKAFQLKEPLKIGINNSSFFGKKCIPYYTEEAKSILLQKLSANKHVNPNKIIPPVQNQSNCWFNTMFVALFISDKGRKFFHYFRQLMIEGKQENGIILPQNLSNAFALLNFAVESSITGSKYAYELDTNNIIKQIYNSIPNTFKDNDRFIVDVDEASNPIKFYNGIIKYLGNDSIKLLIIENLMTSEFKSRIYDEIRHDKLPHIIVIEITDKYSNIIKQKPYKFNIHNVEYMLDSAIIRDTSKNHFCSTIMCEGEEMGYDGMSFHRIVPMKWKRNINSNYMWEFEGSNNINGKPLQWSFTNGYQLLLYYRIR